LPCSSTRKRATAPVFNCSRTSLPGTGASEPSCAHGARKQRSTHRASPPSDLPSPSAAMQIIPAIDIKDGHCVRLRQGEMQSATVFSEDPAAMAQHWLELGAERLHLVDLNGAFAGKPKNEMTIREVVSVIGEEIPIQLGGGIRDLDTIERYLDDGVTYIIIGNAAVRSRGFLHEAGGVGRWYVICGLE